MSVRLVGIIYLLPLEKCHTNLDVMFLVFITVLVERIATEKKIEIVSLLTV